MNADEIESLVRQRRVGLARKAIRRWIKAHRGSLAARGQASDWFRRLSLFREAYLLIAPRTWNFRKAESDPEVALQFLWTARLLNLIGATSFALEIVRDLPLHKPEDLRVLANIYLSAYRFDDALRFFEQAWNRAGSAERSTYQARLGAVGICDALAGVGDLQRALSVLETVQTLPDETLLQGIILQARGEYLARQDDFAGASKALGLAVGMFSADDVSLDRGFLLKWQAFVLGAQGDLESARKIFNQALELLRKPDVRAEAWLECYRLMDRLGLLPIEERLVLYAYPGVPLEFWARSGSRPELCLRDFGARIHLLPGRGEWIDGGVPQIGMSRELHLVALLRAAGDAGISIERLKSLLWPDGLASFPQLQGRLAQLLNRAKSRYGILTRIENGSARIIDGSERNVGVELLRVPALPTFYESRESFDARSFAEFYGLGKSKAYEQLLADVERGVLTVHRYGARAEFTARVATNSE